MMVSKKTSPPVLNVTAEIRPGERSDFSFRKSFRIGRLKECDLCVESSYVSRAHAECTYADGVWMIRDLGSSNGLFCGGSRVAVVPIEGETVIRLGIAGPELRLAVEEHRPAKKPSAGKDPALASYIDRYFTKKTTDESVGERTMYIRQAFAHVEGKRKKKFGIVVSILLAIVLFAGLLAWQEHRELLQQKATAKELFYTIKSEDIDISNLDRALANTQNPAGSEEISRFRARREQTQKSYDQYLATLHIYNPKMTEQQKLILRIARIFGECEIDMPPDFQSEVERYIAKWKSSGRLKSAINVAKQNGFPDTIAHEMLARGLPPQFFYLALQESNFNAYAVGPMTRKGFAKGMWQFIPETAVKYSLRLGPLVDQRRPDPGDDRHDYKKETRAAAEYIQDLYRTDAQASGFLVMACYNWGENQVLPIIRSLPANPKDRNFWRLLAKDRNRIPQETYDYVFSIVSAAVIGENPHLFGFDFDNPLAEVESGTI